MDIFPNSPPPNCVRNLLRPLLIRAAAGGAACSARQLAFKVRQTVRIPGAQSPTK